MPELDIAPEEKTMSASILVSRLSLFFPFFPLRRVGGRGKVSFSSVFCEDVIDLNLKCINFK